MIKRILILILSCLVTGIVSAQQEISPLLFGQNIWLDKLYANNTWNNWGSMDQLWDELGDANLKLIRAGGIHYDENIPTNAIYLEWVDEIRAIGAEPMLQISRKATAEEAMALVTYINITEKRNVKYWIIGNEPDFHWNISTDPSDPYYVEGPSTIKEYTTRISSAIKSIDPSVLVVGPETAWMNDDYLSQLIGGSQDITGKDANGNYYIDVVTYHQYNDPDVEEVETKMNRFLGYLSTANNKRPEEEKLEWAITEFNITTDNDKETDQNKAWSFYAGQYFAEVYGLAMKHGALGITPWSVHESNGDRVAFDLGMFDDGPDFKPRSNYHHVHMMANHFGGTYYGGVVDDEDVTTFGCKNGEEYVVMILNKGTTAHSFDLRFDDQTISVTASLKINIDGDSPITHQGNIGGEETQLLVFNSSSELLKTCVYTKSNATNSEWPVCRDIINSLGSKNKDEFYVFPNPSEDVLNLSESVKWEMFNLTGEHVLIGESNQIDINALSSGVYLLKTSFGTTRVVK